MWVRAQIDYLQRLPNDTEKQRALKKLPPDLPRTYIRIFETIDSVYPVQTTKYVQRLLKWLVFHKRRGDLIWEIFNGVELTLELLLQAICIEDEAEWPSLATMPNVEQILGWLGCLVRKVSNTLELSHFTVKEFLMMDAKDVSSCAARKYLINDKDESYVLDVSLTLMIHDQFKATTLNTWRDVEIFLEKYPLFKFVAWTLRKRIWRSVRSGFDKEPENYIDSPDSARDGSQVPTSIRQDWNIMPGGRMQTFLSTSDRRPFELWAICYSYLLFARDYTGPELPVKPCFTSPLQFAAMMGLTAEVQRLLECGLNPDDVGSLAEGELRRTPLHLAVGNNQYLAWSGCRGDTVLYISCCDTYNDKDQVILERRSQVVKALLESGADLEKQLEVTLADDCDDLEELTIVVTPLVLSVICGFFLAASVLLNAGAEWEVVTNEHRSDNGVQDATASCSLESLLRIMPQRENIVQRAVDLGGHQALKDALAHWKVNREREDRNDISECDSSNDDLTSQERFVEACRMGSWDTVRELITLRPEIEINHNDASGSNPIYCASAAAVDTSVLAFLLDHEAEPNLLTSTGNSAMIRTIDEDCLDKTRLLLQSGANIELSDPGGWTPLLAAVYRENREILELLLDKGANSSAVLDNGAGALQIAIDYNCTEIFSLLLAHGADPTISDNYGTTPLHKACQRGLECEVGRIMESASDPLELTNCESLVLGTPLYVAAREGCEKILMKLLENGAEIDKVVSGNLLGSALMAACAGGHEDAVKLLHLRGASQEVEGSRFRSAIGTATAFRKESIVKILKSMTVIRIEEVG